MTGNQLRFWELQEEKRSNLANEEETHRTNVTREKETERHNLVGESISRATLDEQVRSNIARETETNRHNLISEQLGRDTLNETIRSNVVREEETNRHNVVTEQENERSNRAREYENYRSNVARETETHRANVVYEKEQHRANTTRESQTELQRQTNVDLANRDFLFNWTMAAGKPGTGIGADSFNKESNWQEQTIVGAAKEISTKYNGSKVPAVLPDIVHDFKMQNTNKTGVETYSMGELHTTGAGFYGVVGPGLGATSKVVTTLIK